MNNRGAATRAALATAMRAHPAATYRKLGRIAGLSSPGSVYPMVQAMVKEGKVVVAACPCCGGRVWQPVDAERTYG